MIGTREAKEKAFFMVFRLCGAIAVLALVMIIGFIVAGGIGVLSVEFFTTLPRAANTAGGILSPIVGTMLLMVIVLVFAIPIGILSAIYLVEYQSNRTFSRVSRLVINNLAGVPSIVFGLLGLGLFVSFFALGANLLAAGLTLGLLVLPIVISASRESIQAVPSSIREASMALGASRWQTVRHHVLVYAIPGILTGTILSLSRAAGETAPILLTGAYFYSAALPNSPFDKFTALPFYIYSVSTQTDTGLTSGLVYGAAIALLILALGMNLVAFVLRNRYRKRYRW